MSFIPGSNLLSQALGVIAPQTVAWYQASGRSVNSVGQYATEYNAPVNLQGSFQSVSRNLYSTYGLDFQKSYYVFYVSNDNQDVERLKSPDLIYYNTTVYQCESNNDWFPMDGWVGTLLSVSGLALPTLTKDGKYYA